MYDYMNGGWEFAESLYCDQGDFIMVGAVALCISFLGLS